MNAAYEKSEIVLLAHDHEHDSGLNLEDELVNSKDLACGECQCRRRKERLARRGLIAFIISLIGLLGLLAMSGMCHGMHLLKRQAANNGSETNNGSAFTNQHLWIIIVCVVGMQNLGEDKLITGVLICIVLGVCVASCCCRESFRNPICCPCYTLACCGCLGIFSFDKRRLIFLGCLECIGCGLCCEGLTQL